MWGGLRTWENILVSVLGLILWSGPFSAAVQMLALLLLQLLLREVQYFNTIIEKIKIFKLLNYCHCFPVLAIHKN